MGNRNLIQQSLLIVGLKFLKKKSMEQGKGKGKVHYITGHECPEGEYRYSCTLS